MIQHIQYKPNHNRLSVLQYHYMSGNDAITQRVAKKLKEIRLDRGLRQFDVAEKAKIHPQYYAKIERAEVRPSIDMYERLAKALKVKASDIFPF